MLPSGTFGAHVELIAGLQLFPTERRYLFRRYRHIVPHSIDLLKFMGGKTRRNWKVSLSRLGTLWINESVTHSVLDDLVPSVFLVRDLQLFAHVEKLRLEDGLVAQGRCELNKKTKSRESQRYFPPPHFCLSILAFECDAPFRLHCGSVSEKQEIERTR